MVPRDSVVAPGPVTETNPMTGMQPGSQPQAMMPAGTQGGMSPMPGMQPPPGDTPPPEQPPQAGAGSPAMQPVAGAGEPEPEPPAAPVGPRIPEPMGECPTFTTGTATIAGLRTRIEAGTPGDTKGALLFAWHYTAGTSGAAMSGVPSAVRNEITAGGGIVVAPQGNVGGGGRTDIAPPTGAWFIEDLDYADHVVACAVMNHNIDPNRIHATGCSARGSS
jgi:hypothetical protein